MKWDNKKDTQRLLDFIIKQELDLKDYPIKLKGLLNENFIVYKSKQGITNYVDELIETIIDWENGNKNSSLEKLIEENFVIFYNE